MQIVAMGMVMVMMMDDPPPIRKMAVGGRERGQTDGQAVGSAVVMGGREGGTEGGCVRGEMKRVGVLVAVSSYLSCAASLLS